VGDLNQRITLQDRDIVPPIFGGPDFIEDFTEDNERWAAIQTVHGKTFFDGVNQRDVNLTHEIFIRYDSTVTAETWILYNSRRFDIVSVEDLDEQHEFMRLLCIDKGTSQL
jgi:SPP1 family predicted phage head-tail adaptor